MPEQPNFIAVWDEAISVYKAVSGVLKWVSNPWGQRRGKQPLPDLDKLLNQPCYHAAMTGWGKYPDDSALLELNDDEPMSGYVSLLHALKRPVEDLLIQMRVGRNLHKEDFWPNRKREWDHLMFRCEKAIAEIEQTPQVRDELLTRARDGLALNTPDNTAASAVRAAVGREECVVTSGVRADKLAALLSVPDREPDNEEKKGIRVPDNPDVLRLAKKMKRDLPKGGTQSDVARDFTDGDELKAQSLLRQLRRFPDLLK